MNLPTLTIFARNLVANLSLLQERSGLPPLPVVKANGYGLGIGPLLDALLLADYTPDALCVSTLSEGMEVRQLGWQGALLLLGPTSPVLYSEALRERLLPVCGSLEELRLWLAAGGSTTALLLDTGMARRGLPLSEVQRAAALLDPYGGALDLLTHHACADIADSELPQQQRTLWEQHGRIFRAHRRHSANSAAAFHGVVGSNDTHIRPGLAMYGVEPLATTVAATSAATGAGLLCCFSLTATVAEQRHLKAGQSACYGHEFTASRDTVLGVLPVGYADGIPVAGAATVPLHMGSRKIPICGRVTMDMTLVDLTDIPEQERQVPVTVMGLGGPTVHQWASASQRSPYEILTGLGSRPLRMVA